MALAKRGSQDMGREFGVKRQEVSLPMPLPQVRVVLISYDGLVTGSLELRTDNKNSYNYLIPAYGAPPVALAAPLAGFRANPPTNMTVFGKYSIEYDNPGRMNKIGEPHYDSFLVGISKLNDATFDANFQYLQTNINGDMVLPAPVNPLPFHNCHLRTDVVLNGAQPERCNRAELGFNYAAATHIYLMGPASPQSLNEIQRSINMVDRDEDNPNNRVVVIHVQGEANSTNDEALKTTLHTAPMFSPKQGMFPAAFNLWTGERQMYLIRRMATHSYTVSVLYNEAEAAAFNGQAAARGWAGIPARAAGARLSYMPTIYDAILSFVEECILTRTKTLVNHALYPHFAPLKNALICQDSYDKDNLPSIAFSLISCSPMQHTTIEIISRRIYDSGPAAQNGGNHMAFPMPGNFPGFDAIIAELAGLGLPGAQRNFAPDINFNEWTAPIYTIQPIAGVLPAGTTLADLIRNTGFHPQLTAFVRVNIRNIMSHLLTQHMPAVLNLAGAALPLLTFHVNVTTPLSTTDGEGAISLCGRAGFNQQIFKGHHPSYFWGISNPPVGAVLGANPHITPIPFVPPPPAGAPAAAPVPRPAWDWAGLLPPVAGFMIVPVVNAIGGRKSKRNRNHKKKSRRRR